MKIPAARRASGFTLVELLVVISIIAVLAAAGFSAGNAAIQKAKKMTALATCTALESAVNNFYSEYGTMPSTGEADKTVDTKTDTEFLKILLGRDTTENPRAIKFLSVKEGKANKNGMIYNGIDPKGLYDPWGGPYKVRLDLDYDEQVEPDVKAGGSTELNGRRVAAWSDGEDGVDGKGNGSDDVKTW